MTTPSLSLPLQHPLSSTSPSLSPCKKLGLGLHHSLGPQIAQLCFKHDGHLWMFRSVKFPGFISKVKLIHQEVLTASFTEFFGGEGEGRSTEMNGPNVVIFINFIGSALHKTWLNTTHVCFILESDPRQSSDDFSSVM